MPAKLSLVIPCFNEEKNLPTLFVALENFLRTRSIVDIEIVLVNDGSHDQTEALLCSFERERAHVVRVVTYAHNRGKGYAVRVGMLAARSDWCILLDADLAVSLEEVRRLLPRIENGQTQVIIGSRCVPGSVIEKPQGFLRRLLGTGYTILARLVTGVDVSDFTCGFKCFSAHVARVIFSQAKVDRWSYDAEILYLAQQQGFKIVEVPVHWHNGTQTQVRLMRDITKSLIDLLRIRFIHSRK